MIDHTLHLHGHTFQVLQIGDEEIFGALRDTINIPSGQVVVKIAFDANNPGSSWLLHSTNPFLFAAGMITTIEYQ